MTNCTATKNANRWMISLPYTTAEDRRKVEEAANKECRSVGAYIRNLITQDLAKKEKARKAEVSNE